MGSAPSDAPTTKPCTEGAGDRLAIPYTLHFWWYFSELVGRIPTKISLEFDNLICLVGGVPIKNA